ncbi:MAG: PAS domain-containing protein [Methanobacterium sp. ERen5]|nr:MAG: PAS domain-containing protein [Methanobacterium sp. ERen5]
MDEPNKTDRNRAAWPVDANFQEIFYQSPIGIFLYDKNGQLTNANYSALNITRIPTLDDVLCTNIFDNPKIASKKEELHEQKIIKFKESLNLIKIKESNIYNPLEQKLICIDWTVSVTDSGYLIQIQDITDNKKVVEIIQESDATYHGLFDLLDEAIQISEIVFDAEGHPVDTIILDVNPAYEQQTGLKKKK